MIWLIFAIYFVNKFNLIAKLIKMEKTKEKIK